MRDYKALVLCRMRDTLKLNDLQLRESVLDMLAHDALEIAMLSRSDAIAEMQQASFERAGSPEHLKHFYTNTTPDAGLGIGELNHG